MLCEAEEYLCTASECVGRMRKNLIFAVILIGLLSFAGIAQRAKTDALKVGETAPDFSLVSNAGKTVNLSSYKEPVVLVFYRAYW